MTYNDETPLYEQIDLLTRILITFVVMTGTFMAILDTTIVDVVIPKMIAPLKTDLYGVQWVITSYMAAAATGLLLIESLDKVLGLRVMFIMGITLFTLSSVACGFAENLTQMIIARSAQGVGEAFVVATAQTILFSIYPPNRKGIAMGIYGMGVSFAPALGPTLGGWLTEHLTWRYIFFVNLPVGLMIVLVGILILPKIIKQKQKLRFNFISYTFLGTFTISLLILLSKGQQKGWFQSDFIIIAFIIAVAALFLYAIAELLSKHKLIDFKIFKVPQYRYACVIYFFTLGLSIYQLFYMIPLFYENLKGYSTLNTGLHMLGFAVFIGMTSPIAGILSDKFGEKYVLVVNAALYITTSIFLMPNLNYFTPSLRTILLTIPLGFSLGTFFAPITTMAMRHLREYTSLGVSLMHYLRFMGGAFGTAIATNTLQSKTAMHYEGIISIQNFDYVRMYLNSVSEKFSAYMPERMAELRSEALLAKLQQLMGLNEAFQDVFLHAGFFGIFGLSFLILIFLHDKKIEKNDKTV
ncbi:DHA2 family efflux MFS transporter permease subunit [Flexistipes sinusarabici]|uniref:DHA2 family efflux MFS transporter permease subunit n=1 Tax=Flexistipes sinusarabici TaxID=2352 RepID=UPI0023566278|nr:DHA2 family efflux MFS transporter permease subunit [Flexistipes sinusarabici]